MRVVAVVRAGGLDGGDLVVDLGVAPGQERATVDDHVDLVGTGVHGVPRVSELHRKAGATGREGRGHGRHVHT